MYNWPEWLNIIHLEFVVFAPWLVNSEHYRLNHFFSCAQVDVWISQIALIYSQSTSFDRFPLITWPKKRGKKTEEEIQLPANMFLKSGYH